MYDLHLNVAYKQKLVSLHVSAAQPTCHTCFLPVTFCLLVVCPYKVKWVWWSKVKDHDLKAILYLTGISQEHLEEISSKLLSDSKWT